MIAPPILDGPEAAAYLMDMHPTPAHDPNREIALGYAEHAMMTMRALGVMPTPKHYTVFFSAAAHQPPELARELALLMEREVAFTDELIDHLYQDHIAAVQSRAVQETAVGARKIIAEMVHAVAAFAGNTQSVGQEVAHQLDKLGDDVSEEELRSIAQTVISSASTMKQSSESMTQKLAGAQAEIATLRENLARATTESERDFLTNSYNRKAFDKRLLEAMEEAQDSSSELSLLMLDIDHFKQFNDQYGHQIGDEVLKIVARSLIDAVKGADTVARYGGEEFAIILPRTPIGGGMIVAETIRKQIACKEFKNKATGEVYGVITVSMGVAAFRHMQNDTPARLIKRADEALYRSKHAGRNRVTQENLSE